MSDIDNRYSPFWPVTVGLLTLLILLGYQLHFTFQAGNNMQKQIKAQEANVSQAAESAKKIQGELEGIVNDVLVLAESDATAKAVVDKYQIRRNAETSAPAAE